MYFEISQVTKLPQVELLYRYQGQDMRLVKAAVENGAEGVIIAFTGNGSASDTHEALIDQYAKQGIPIVRTTVVALTAG
jgi:L-asparaginase